MWGQLVCCWWAITDRGSQSSRLMIQTPAVQFKRVHVTSASSAHLFFPSELWMRGDVSFKSLTAAAQNGSQFKVGTEPEPVPHLEKKDICADLLGTEPDPVPHLEKKEMCAELCLFVFSEFWPTDAGKQDKDVRTQPGMRVSAGQRGRHEPLAVWTELLMSTHLTCD